MEGKNRYVSTNFWTDPYIDNLTPIEKLIYLWLMTNDKQNVAGVFEFTYKKCSNETSYKINEIELAIKKFTKDKKLELVENYILLFNTIKHQKPNINIIKGISQTLDALPEKVKASKGFQRLCEGFRNINLNININSNLNININLKDAPDIFVLWIKTWGKNPSIPEQEETQKLIDRFGYEHVHKIMYQSKLDGFKNFGTLIRALDDNGNIKPKENYNGIRPKGSIDFDKYQRERKTIPK